MKTIQMAVVLKNSTIAEGIFDMALYAPEIVKEAAAGQFVELYTGSEACLLPRPISICEINREKGSLRLVYQTVGKGTHIFSRLREGETIRVMGPCGNGFFPENKTSHLVIGGGIGAPPLLELVKQLQGKVSVFLGSKSHPILAEDFRALGAEVFIATEDGSVGYHGNVISLAEKMNREAEAIYACGPRAMLRATAGFAQKRNIAAQVSLEERMACGIGACVGCTVKIQRKGDSDWQYLKVCKDGPVFQSHEVVWDAE